MTHLHVRRSVARRTRAFSLIELLIVIGIIGVLVSIVFAVGRSVNSSAKRQLTVDTLSILDTALAAYMNETGGLPPAFAEFPNTNPNQPPNFWPVADARDMEHTATLTQRRSGNQMINSVGLFIREAEKVPRVKTILDKLPSKLVVRYDPDNDAGTDTNQPVLTTVMDAWGNPIRFVHPVFDGRIEGTTAGSPKAVTDLRVDRNKATRSLVSDIRRGYIASGNVRSLATPAQGFADSDGGRCTGNRPYFYSAGEDGLVGYALIGGVHVSFNDDNVYTNAPSFPPKPTP